MTEKMTCPGCGKQVRLLAPRGDNSSRFPVGWRRQQHYLPGNARCRYPVNLTDAEVARHTGPTKIRRRKDTTP